MWQISLHRIFSDLVAELPFTLMHPKPDDEDTFPILSDRSPTKSSTNEDEATDSNKDKQSEVATANLIQLDG